MLMNDAPNLRPSFFARRVAAAAFVVCVSAAAAQSPAQTVTDGPAAATPATLMAAANRPLDLATVAGVNYSSSTSSTDATPAAEGLTFTGAGTEALQPPPRRRYGRPRYNDSSHNPDGSNKYAFIAGVGLTVPVGNTHKYDKPSYGFQVGGGRNFNKNFSVIAQFDYDNFGLQGSTIANQSELYFGALNQGLDGNSHIWSFSLDPVFNFYSSEGLGAYAVVGVGFYHKVTNFTLPEAACADYYCQFQYLVNENVDHYTSNAPGFNGGLGLTFKPSRFANERFYVEGRYVFVDNSQRTGVTINSPTATLNTYTGTNLYPANSNRTSYVPIKVGVRF